LGGGSATGEGADAEHEFGEVEWLGEVVGVEDWAAVLDDETRARAVARGGDADPAAWSSAPRLRPLTRCAGVPDAVSMSTIAGFSRSVIMRQMVSPCIPGRSRSRTTTS